jgi:ribonuclease P protein component
MSDQRFRPQYRVRRPADFRRAYQRRCSASDDRIVVFAYANDLPHPRLGISVSRRIGCAVVRARWKRLVREAFRLTRRQLPDGIDLIVIPRADVQPTLASLLDSLPRLAQRASRKLNRPGPPLTASQ